MKFAVSEATVRRDGTLPIVIGLHTEKLHEDQTWRHVQQIAAWTGERGIKATFFVYPFRAQMAGKDITHRVREIAAWGHEIGQHTHFYAGTKIDSPEKVDDLSAENILLCLTRDFSNLKQMGFRPRAFTAGAWFMNPTICDSLVNLGFAYDCSARYPKPRENLEMPNHLWIRVPRVHSNDRGRIICLPTICSLGEWFKWGRRVSIEGKLPYQLVYLHDYDLLSLSNRILLFCLLAVCKRRLSKPLATIAEHYKLEG